MSTFPVGTRVRLRLDIDRYPHFTMDRGMLGTVMVNDNGYAWVKMDQHVPGCEAWDNQLALGHEWGDLDEHLEVIT